MENLLIILVSIIAGVIGYTINVKLKKGPVLGSAVVTLLSGILFPYIAPGMGLLPVVATTAGYASMVAVKNVKNIKEMSFVGLIAGVLFISTLSAYPGVGGRLGTIAGISCFSFIGLKKVYSLITDRVENKNTAI